MVDDWVSGANLIIKRKFQSIVIVNIKKTLKPFIDASFKSNTSGKARSCKGVCCLVLLRQALGSFHQCQTGSYGLALCIVMGQLFL